MTFQVLHSALVLYDFIFTALIFSLRSKPVMPDSLGRDHDTSSNPESFLKTLYFTILFNAPQYYTLIIRVNARRKRWLRKARGLES